VFTRFIIVVAGFYLALEGYKEFQVSRGTSATPTPVALADLEQGKSPSSNFVVIGQHNACFPMAIFQYSKREGDNARVTRSTRVDHVYYPIISDEHPYFEEVAKMLEKYPTVEEVPENEWPSITEFRVLVKTKRFRDVASIPSEYGEEANIAGMFVNEIEPLEEDDKRLIRENFSSVKFGEILILEQFRTPASWIKSFAMIVGGAMLSLATIGSFLLGGDPDEDEAGKEKQDVPN
jgi:hypothetical protein